VTIYADTSFLISFLYAGDLNHGKARQFFRSHGADTWLISAWSQYETVNALRSLCLAPNGPKPAFIAGVCQLFKRLQRDALFTYSDTDWDDAFREANRLSAAVASHIKSRAGDSLHVALLAQLKPDLFVTFDKDQSVLAARRGFRTALIR
jgi:predicted nucleic acid-binding protein